MIKINMRSAAHTVKGQGVGACYEEQVNLVKTGLSSEFEASENKRGRFDIVHYHTINLSYFIKLFYANKQTIGIEYVHFLPDTLETSIQLSSY